LSIRNDTNYWQANNDRVYSPGLEQVEPQPFFGFYDLAHRKMITGNVPLDAGITRIAAGMNYPILDAITIAYEQIRKETPYEEKFAKSFETFEKKKAWWKKSAESELTLYEYLKKMYGR
jgi:hypothetical protein